MELKAFSNTPALREFAPTSCSEREQGQENPRSMGSGASGAPVKSARVLAGKQAQGHCSHVPLGKPLQNDHGGILTRGEPTGTKETGEETAVGERCYCFPPDSNGKVRKVVQTAQQPRWLSAAEVPFSHRHRVPPARFPKAPLTCCPPPGARWEDSPLWPSCSKGKSKEAETHTDL